VVKDLATLPIAVESEPGSLEGTCATETRGKADCDSTQARVQRVSGEIIRRASDRDDEAFQH